MKIDLQETYDWPISGRDKAMKEKLAEEEEKQHDWRDTDAPSEADVSARPADKEELHKSYLLCFGKTLLKKSQCLLHTFMFTKFSILHFKLPFLTKSFGSFKN